MRPAGPERETALEEFYKQWKDDSLVMLKWIALQVGQQGLHASFGPNDACIACDLVLGKYSCYKRYKSAATLSEHACGGQAGANVPGNLKNVEKLVEHPAFSIKNPNACYSLFLSFLRSAVNFHAADGSGYKFIADSVLKVGPSKSLLAMLGLALEQ